MKNIQNIFEFDKAQSANEIFEKIATGDVIIERIISTGQTTADDEWYDQDADEWVVLLQGEAKLQFEGVGEVRLEKGSHILIKAHERHKVTYTSSEPPCIWIAVHGNLTMQ